MNCSNNFGKNSCVPGRLTGQVGVVILIFCGEVPELAEGARLEIVCPPKRRTEGSNPSLSARIPDFR